MSTTSTPRLQQRAQGAIILGIWTLCTLVLIDAFTTKYLWGQIVAGTESAYSASEVATAQSVTYTEHFQALYQQGLLKYSLALRYIIWGISMFIAALGFIAASIWNGSRAIKPSQSSTLKASPSTGQWLQPDTLGRYRR